MAASRDIELVGKGAPAGTPQDEQAAIKRKLAKRMIIAALMIAALLGALAMFDRLSQTEEAIEPPTPRPPVRLPQQEVIKPLTPPADPAAGKGAEELPPKPEVTPQPTVPQAKDATSQPAPAAPASRPGAAQPSAPAQPPAPAQPSGATPAPSMPPAGQAPRLQLAPAPKPEAKVDGRSAPGVAERSAVPAVPVTPVPAPKTLPAPEALTVKPPVVTAPRPLLSGYVLQAGVFTNVKRAEELHAKLLLNGIPSTLEARVHVGPFKSRREAELAQEKLRALGVEPVLIPPKQ